MPAIGRAQRRLVIALGVSLALHAWMMQSHYGKGAAGGGSSAITARILPVATGTDSVASSSTPLPAPMTNNVAVSTTDSNAVAQRATQVSHVSLASAAIGTPAPAVLTQPSDPNYYAVGDLDVFPKALVKPDLNAALAANQTPAAGKVRATLLIDEAGVVNAVRNVEAPAREIESVARELLLRTRFTPARNKEGRIVKAQVLVALDYDTRGAVAPR